MKTDANSILRQHGPDRLRGLIDAAEPFKPRNEQEPPSRTAASVRSEKTKIHPAPLVTPSEWPEGDPPPIDWLVETRIPCGDVTTLAGDGGTGKTDIALQLAAAGARRAPYWLGHPVKPGKVLLVSAEEPQREVWRRIALHAERDGYSFRGALGDLHMWFPDDITDPIMATADKSGVMRPTPLFMSIAKAIEDLEPVLVIVDNVAATFAGEQNNRVSARTYVNLWRGIAHSPAGPAVLLLDHPSLSGMNNGSGRSGNMDWRNAVRSALYLKSPEDKADADRGIRVLETAKSNYAKFGPQTAIRLEWREGGLVPEAAPTSLQRLRKDTEAEDTFLRLLDERAGQGRYVSDKASSPSYAPKVFAKCEDNGGFTKEAFARAMDRLFQTGRLSHDRIGPPSDRKFGLARARPRLVDAAE